LPVCGVPIALAPRGAACAAAERALADADADRGKDW